MMGLEFLVVVLGDGMLTVTVWNDGGELVGVGAFSGWRRFFDAWGSFPHAGGGSMLKVTDVATLVLATLPVEGGIC